MNRYPTGSMNVVCGRHGVRYSASRKVCPHCPNDSDEDRIPYPTEDQTDVQIVAVPTVDEAKP